MESDTADWEIERICGKMYCDDGVHYEVKWLGYDSSFNRFLPLVRLNCDDYIEEYENRHEL